MHITSNTFTHHGDLVAGAQWSHVRVIMGIHDVVFLSGIIVISHLRRTLVLALISHLILLYMCFAS